MRQMTYVVLSVHFWLSHRHHHVWVLHLNWLACVWINLVLSSLGGCHLLMFHSQAHLLLVFRAHLGHLSGKCSLLVLCTHRLAIIRMHFFHFSRRLLFLIRHLLFIREGLACIIGLSFWLFCYLRLTFFSGGRLLNWSSIFCFRLFTCRLILYRLL